MKKLLETDDIKTKIYRVRGVCVMLDRDLAELYQVETKQLKRAVKRNAARFPNDFMFMLNSEEYKSIRYQNGTIKRGAHSKYLPYAFTEHGTLALASVLNSEIAIKINQTIIRTFIELRKQITTNPKYELLSEKMKYIESKLDTLDLSQKIDINIVSKKMQKLSQEVYRMSQVLDEFQNTHLIIKRPESGL
jgi:hypothetical protein